MIQDGEDKGEEEGMSEGLAIVALILVSMFLRVLRYGRSWNLSSKFIQSSLIS